MINMSVGVFAIILGLLFLAILWVFIRNIRRKMYNRVEQPIATGFPGSDRDERRHQDRLDVAWPVEIRTPEGIIAARLKDLSLGGSFVICDTPLPLKGQFDLTIEIPERAPITLKSEVLWSNGNVPEDRVVNRGMGIRFIQNAAEVREALKNALLIENSSQESWPRAVPELRTA